MTETLNKDQLDGLLTGHTIFLETPAGEAAIRLGHAGQAGARLPAGATLSGTWRLNADSYTVDWDNGPKGSSTRIIRDTTGLAMQDATNGDPRGQVLRIVMGNPEGL